MSQTHEQEHIPGHIWTPVRTKPRREKKLAEYCEAKGVEFYLPLKKRIHRYGRRTVEFFIPMFPGYVFCCLDEKKYQTILRSNCIVFRINIDEAGEEELLRELKSIRAFEKLSHETEVTVKPELVEGARVKINSGPFQGTTGFIERRKGKTLLTVNIEILGQSVTAEVDAGDLDVDKD